MNPRPNITRFREMHTYARLLALRWLLTITSEIGMTMSRWSDRLQIKIDAEQDGHNG